MFIYCICTQYLVVAPFALITASYSAWHGGDQFCGTAEGGMEAQFLDSGRQLIFIVGGVWCLSSSS